MGLTKRPLKLLAVEFKGEESSKVLLILVVGATIVTPFLLNIEDAALSFSALNSSESGISSGISRSEKLDARFLVSIVVTSVVIPLTFRKSVMLLTDYENVLLFPSEVVDAVVAWLLLT